jgi:hypothetical protein
VPITELKKSNASLRGDRIKSARMLAGYTRKAFADKFSIPIPTIRAWEEPPVGRNGVTVSGAKRLIKVFHESGIYCTEDWILHGRGPGPTIVDRYCDSGPEKQITWGEEESILRDIESFKQNNRSAMVAVVTDRAMLPYYNYGDYVGGEKKTGRDIRSLVGLNCIVEVGGKILIRRISMIDQHNRYTLTALNMELPGIAPVMLNVEIAAASQIVWHRGRARGNMDPTF